jgi:hypothetical protein
MLVLDASTLLGLAALATTLRFAGREREIAPHVAAFVRDPE